MKFEERGKNIDHKKALIWLLSSADKMKNEIENINNFFSKNNLKPEKIKVSNQKVENMNEAVKLANDSSLGLTSSVWSKNHKKAIQIAKKIFLI